VTGNAPPARARCSLERFRSAGTICKTHGRDGSFGHSAPFMIFPAKLSVPSAQAIAGSSKGFCVITTRRKLDVTMRFWYTPPQYIVDQPEETQSMPLYEYECDECGQGFELLVGFSQADKAKKCPGCGGEKTHRKVSSFAMGGSSRSGSGAVSSAPVSSPFT